MRKAFWISATVAAALGGCEASYQKNATAEAEAGQQNQGAQAATVDNVRRPVPPIPKDIVILDAEETQALIKDKDITTASLGHIGSKWRFDYKKDGHVEHFHWGGIAPVPTRLDIYSIMDDGKLCIGKDRLKIDWGCFSIGRDVRKRYFWMNPRYSDGRQSDWRRVQVFIKPRKG